jgi:hypothetical protein
LSERFAEVGRVLSADARILSGYAPGGAVTVGGWVGSESGRPLAAGIRFGRRSLHTRVFRTGRPARIDDYADASTRPPT